MGVDYAQQTVVYVRATRYKKRVAAAARSSIQAVQQRAEQASATASAALSLSEGRVQRFEEMMGAPPRCVQLSARGACV